MRRCLGCFEEKRDDLEVCPFCGYIDGTTAEEAVHIEPGTILSGRYIIGKVLGYGGFGVTYIGWDSRLEQKVAIKEYLPSEFSTRMPGQSRVTIFNGIKNEQYVSGLNKFVEEAKKLSKFQKEDGIVKIYDCIAENDTAYIIMEYLEGEPLSERLKREKIIPEEEAIGILIPVMKSLEIVHKEGIIHRDISPDNIFLLNDGRVKLIDFGAARYATTSHSRSLTVIIKPGYSAEEQYRSTGDQGPHTDVYSLAAVLYKMLTGQTPPDALERRSKIESIKKDILIEPHSLNKSISQVTENAVLNALNIRIEDRTPTIQGFIDDLMSEFPVKRKKGQIKRIDFYGIPLWVKVMIPIVLILIVTIGMLLFTGIISFESLFSSEVKIPEGYTLVPNVEGQSIDEAINEIRAAGLEYSTGGNAVSDYIEADLIVFQNPEAGRMISAGSTVEITISRGSGDVVLPVDGISTIPVFLWSEEADAIRDFETAGLNVTTEYEYNDYVTEGQVIRAENSDGNEIRAGNQLSEGSGVVIVVSAGIETFEVPDVNGLTEEAAIEVLEQSGFSVNVEYYDYISDTDEFVYGCVYSSDPVSGSMLPSGSEITITVNSSNASDVMSVTSIDLTVEETDAVVETLVDNYTEVTESHAPVITVRNATWNEEIDPQDPNYYVNRTWIELWVYPCYPGDEELQPGSIPYHYPTSLGGGRYEFYCNGELVFTNYCSIYYPYYNCYYVAGGHHRYDAGEFFLEGEYRCIVYDEYNNVLVDRSCILTVE